ncbi:hypothetical protein [Siphonobacter sp. SORGH_AS_0500]|uniref:hypothetical protein n=1 Tax=Siphonobacter sp. SORGH_AS_0500 TaxID=1864824 RepID=UPI0028596553|nr:hypothetical protein [Siphonobacter sp. SORGH_AS_0500]MDR6195638.1 hypothetical protein [Siphonobacter sp. SORGH_AS_0500]
MNQVLSWLKKRVDLFNEEWLIYVIAFVVILIIWFAAYAIADFSGGRTIIIQGEVIGHRFEPAYDEPLVNVINEEINGVSTQRIEYTVIHHYDNYILTVLTPDGPRDFSVDPPVYTYYRDNDLVPIHRRIGKYSNTCLASWISQ